MLGLNVVLYETLDILCQHALYVLQKKKLMELLEHYTLHRWTLSVRYMVRRTLSKFYIRMFMNHMTCNCDEHQCNCYFNGISLVYLK